MGPPWRSTPRRLHASEAQAPRIYSIWTDKLDKELRFQFARIGSVGPAGQEQERGLIRHDRCSYRLLKHTYYDAKYWRLEKGNGRRRIWEDVQDQLDQ